MSRESSELKRTVAFQQRFAQAQASSIVDLTWGYALLQRQFPLSHHHNRVVVTAAASSDTILSTTERVLGEAGMRHRRISVGDAELAETLSAAFEDAGYAREALTTMVYRGPQPALPEHAVHEVSLEVMAPAIARDWRVAMPDASDDEVDQLVGRTGLYADHPGVTLLAVRARDEIAARAELYVDVAHGIAQLESLNTHGDHRGKGYATSLVREALRRSVGAGCSLAFLEADLDDWPREWYARLGYEEVGQSVDFSLVPE